jgi:hypothetical protein
MFVLQQLSRACATSRGSSQCGVMLQTVVSKKRCERARRRGCSEEEAHKLLEAAKDLTKEEFRDKLRRMMWHLEYQLQSKGSSIEAFRPLLSFDHNGAQEYADLEYKAGLLPPGLETTNLRRLFWPLPRYSPDCHRVIEHVFGQMSNKLHMALLDPATSLTDSQSIAAWWVQQFQQLSPSSINKDVQGLPDVYKYIAEHDGSWAPRNMR